MSLTDYKQRDNVVMNGQHAIDDAHVRSGSTSAEQLKHYYSMMSGFFGV